MSRYLALAVLLTVSSLASAQPRKPGGQDVPEGGNLQGSPTEDAVCPKGGRCPLVPWDEKSPVYGAFFRYQRYLVKIDAPAETESAWPKLTGVEQRVRINRVNGFIRNRFAEILRSPYPSNDDSDFIKTVWGEEVAAGFAAVAAVHRRDNVDDATKAKMLAQAEASLKKTAAKVGGITLADIPVAAACQLLDEIRTCLLRSRLLSCQNCRHFVRIEKRDHSSIHS